MFCHFVKTLFLIFIFDLIKTVKLDVHLAFVKELKLETTCRNLEQTELGIPDYQYLSQHYDVDLDII